MLKRVGSLAKETDAGMRKTLDRLADVVGA
jgi:hypothetical protein